MLEESRILYLIVFYFLCTDRQLLARLVNFQALFSEMLTDFSDKYPSELFFQKNYFDPNVNQSLFQYEPFDDPILLSHANSVIEKSCGKWVNILIFIVSNPINFEARNLIRRSYGKIKENHNYYKYEEATNDFSHCFIFTVGYTDDYNLNFQIDFESIMYGDIVRIPLYDSYYLLPYKVMASLHILDNFNSKYDYLLKMDDDILVKTRLLIPAIYKYYQDCPIVSHIKINAGVIRDVSSKYYLSPKEFKDEVFPPCPEGGAYFVHRTVISKITAQFKLSSIIRFEDVNTGQIAKDLNLKLCGYFRMHHCVDNGYHGCHNSYVILIGTNYNRREEIVNYYRKEYS